MNDEQIQSIVDNAVDNIIRKCKAVERPGLYFMVFIILMNSCSDNLHVNQMPIKKDVATVTNIVSVTNMMQTTGLLP